MAYLDRSHSPYWQTSDPDVCLREKPDRRRFYREPLPTPLAATECRVLSSPTAIKVSGCETAGEAIAQIAAAKANG